MTRGYIYINILGAGYKAHNDNVQIFRTGSMNCTIPVEGFICTINSLLMNNLVCSQLFLQTLFSPLSQTLFLPIPVSWHSLVNGCRHFWKWKLDCSFVYPLMIADTPYILIDSWQWNLSNLQINKNISFDKVTEQWGSVYSNLHLAKKSAVNTCLWTLL